MKIKFNYRKDFWSWSWKSFWFGVVYLLMVFLFSLIGGWFNYEIAFAFATIIMIIENFELEIIK